MYKHTRKEKIPSFFLQQASKYMLKCSKITEMDRDIYHALHDVHLYAFLYGINMISPAPIMSITINTTYGSVKLPPETFSNIAIRINASVRTTFASG